MAFDPLPYFTVGGIIVTMAVGLLQIKSWVKQKDENQQRTLDTKVSQGVERLISHIDKKIAVIDEKFNTTDKEIGNNKDEIKDIEEDVKVLEKDFKQLCEKIGKHDYIVDKILPEYIDLRDSIYSFKAKIDENLLSNKDKITRNTDEDIGEEGLK